MRLAIRSCCSARRLLVSRSPRRSLATLTDRDAAFFESLLGKSGVVTDAQDLERFNSDWTGEFRGHSKLAVRPASTEEVAEIMRYCFQRDIPVVPQGGNTGLVGGSIPMKDELIISLSRMNKIRGFDEVLGAITCEAGVTLQTAEEYVQQRNHVMPLDLGSKGSCQIGGNLATNAGGIRLIKYGSLRGNILGLKAVLSDGRVLDSMRTLRKDNVGYDLKQLFVGSEGTLGIITECAVLTPPKPEELRVVLIPMDSFDDAIHTLKSAKRFFNSALSAFEYLDEASFELVKTYSKGQKDFKLQTKTGRVPSFYVVMEIATEAPVDGGDDPDARLITFLDSLGGISDVAISKNAESYKSIWGLRENITSSLRSSGMRVFKYDVSLPARTLHEATMYVKGKLLEEGYRDVRVFEYGHLGDGNLHFNAGSPRSTSPGEIAKVQDAIENHLYSFVKSKEGSVSAEHGLGQLKAKKILYSRTPIEVEWMKNVKRTFDPKGILNPGKVLI